MSNYRKIIATAALAVALTIGVAAPASATNYRVDTNYATKLVNGV